MIDVKNLKASLKAIHECKTQDQMKALTGVLIETINNQTIGDAQGIGAGDFKIGVHASDHGNFASVAFTNLGEGTGIYQTTNYHLKNEGREPFLYISASNPNNFAQLGRSCINAMEAAAEASEGEKK